MHAVTATPSSASAASLQTPSCMVTIQEAEPCEEDLDLSLSVPARMSTRDSASSVKSACPPTPPVDRYLTDRGYVKMSATKEFNDLSLAGAAAGFVAFKPLTMLYRRRPFRIFTFLFAALFTLKACERALREWDDRDDLGPPVLLLSLGESAVPACGLWVAPFLAMCGRPRWATVMAGISFALASLLLLSVWLPLLWWDGFDDELRWSEGPVDLVAVDIVSLALLEVLVAVTFLFKEGWWWRTSVAITLLLISRCIYRAIRGPLRLFLFSLIPISLVTFMHIFFFGLRWWSLRQATLATKFDQARYDEVWQTVEQQHMEELVSLAEVAATAPHERRMQPFCSLAVLYQNAFALNEWYQAVVRQWADVCRVRALPAQVKVLQRTLEKVHRSYNGEFRKVLDLVRAALVVRTIGDVRKVLEHIMNNAIVHQVKNRFAPNYNSAVTAGYRDLNCQLSFRELAGSNFQGFIFELQIHYEPILALKSNDGHKRYIRLRNLRGD